MQAEAILKTVANVLDSLTIGCCVFDSEDRTVLWNSTMLAFFRNMPGTFMRARRTGPI